MDSFKNIITLCTFSLFLFSFSNCGSSQTNDYSLTQEPPFSIEDSYFQKWVAGVRGGGSGINVHLSFNTLPENVKIDSIYFRNKVVKAKQVSQDPIQFVGYFKTETNRDVIMDVDAKEEATNVPPKKTPFQLAENAAVISYSKKGTLQYYKLTNIAEKQMLAYPQSKSPSEN